MRDVIAAALKVASSANPAQAASAGLNPAVTLGYQPADQRPGGNGQPGEAAVDADDRPT